MRLQHYYDDCIAESNPQKQSDSILGIEMALGLLIKEDALLFLCSYLPRYEYDSLTQQFRLAYGEEVLHSIDVVEKKPGNEIGETFASIDVSKHKWMVNRIFDFISAREAKIEKAEANLDDFSNKITALLNVRYQLETKINRLKSDLRNEAQIATNIRFEHLVHELANNMTMLIRLDSQLDMELK